MRAKLKIETVTKHEHGETLKFRAVGKDEPYDENGSDENNSFAKFTPSATLEMEVQNPELLDKFSPGDTFYVDFTKVED